MLESSPQNFDSPVIHTVQNNKSIAVCSWQVIVYIIIDQSERVTDRIKNLHCDNMNLHHEFLAVYLQQNLYCAAIFDLSGIAFTL